MQALFGALALKGPAAGLMLYSDCDSQGEFNRSLQHLQIGGVRWGGHEVGLRNRLGAGADVFSGQVRCQSARDATSILKPHCRGNGECDSRVGERWIVALGAALVSRGWRHAANRFNVTLGLLYLLFLEREELAPLRAQDLGVREIARRLGRSPSTVSSERRRNAATRSGPLTHRATVTQWQAKRAVQRPKAGKLAQSTRLRPYVQDRLANAVTDAKGRLLPGPNLLWTWKGRQHGRRADRRCDTGWRPEQIRRRLRADFPGDESMRISDEAIYPMLYIQSYGALRHELSAYLRTRQALRVPQARTQQRDKSVITAEVLISQRPAKIADRAVPAHWEEYLIIGQNCSAIGTLA